MKTNKSYSKRIKVTATGKARIRKPGKNHFNARKSRTKLLSKRGTTDSHISIKTMRQHMPHADNLEQVL